MSLLEKNVMIEKASNQDIVEEGDVVLLTIKINDNTPYSLQITVGDDEINEDIDNALKTTAGSRPCPTVIPTGIRLSPINSNLNVKIICVKP